MRTRSRSASTAPTLRLAGALIILVVLVVGPLALAACAGSSTTSTGSATPASGGVAASPTSTAKPLPAPTVAGTIVFARTDWPHPAIDVYVVNTDGSGFRPLTDDGQSYLPSWSPDGGKIVYSQGDNSAVMVMNADGSGKVALAKGSVTEPSWSPDGKQIAYIKGLQRGMNGWAVWVMNADGGGKKQLTDGHGYDLYPSWTRDGKVFFNRDKNNKSYTINPDGSGLKVWRGEYPVSPDGSLRIAVKSDRIQIVPVKGGGPAVTVIHPLKDFISDEQVATAWAPDGKAVTVTSNLYEGALGSRIYIVGPDGSGLSAVPGVDYAFNPSWRPQ